MYFNTSVDRLAMGEMAFKAQLYQTVMGEALEMKSDITHRRSTNNFGNIVWQYNEIWPTGGWGSVECEWGERAAALASPRLALLARALTCP